jgi:hypothetical protein
MRLRLAALVAVGFVAFAAAALAGVPVTVSGPSPYASCSTSPLLPDEFNYVNAEVEPWISVNPTNSVNFVGVWQQDRFSFGGAHGLVAGFTSTGGTSWGETTLPFSSCAPGGLNFERASDPWVSFGPDGRAYAVSISFNEVANVDNSVAASTSTDGGKTWSPPRLVDLITGADANRFFDDKESVTADPTRPGVAYVVWDRFTGGHNDNPNQILHSKGFTSPAMFSKTVDGGAHWSAPQVIYDPGWRNNTIGNQIVVDPRNDALYDFFAVGYKAGPLKGGGSAAFYEAVIKSTDGGSTWSAPTLLATDQDIGVTVPGTNIPLRTGSGLPDAAIDAATGRLYVVWEDSRFNGGKYDEIALSTSSDGGATWTAPIRANRPTGLPAFTPSVEVNSAGTVGVTYYDMRTLTSPPPPLPTDYWLTTSTDHGASFTTETHLDGPFDELTAPNAGGFFLGDYEGLATVGTSFVSFFAHTNSGNTANRTDIVSEKTP